MKKELPQGLVIAAIALSAIAAGFLLWRGVQGPPELPRAPINVGAEPVPEYMKDQMTPEMRKMIEEQSAKYGTPAPGADSASSQGAPGR